MHSLKVIIDDYTFAHTNGRRPQPFGSAGDCYSTTKRCPRGAFAINFESTKFRLKPNTHWDTRGNDVIQHFYGVSRFFSSSQQNLVSVCVGDNFKFVSINSPLRSSLKRRIKRLYRFVVDIVEAAHHPGKPAFIWKSFEAIRNGIKFTRPICLWNDFKRREGR